MDDKTTSNTDEYKFNESEVTPAGDTAVEYGQSEAEPTIETAAQTSAAESFGLSLKDKLKRFDLKRLRKPIAIVVAIIIVYTIFSVYSSRKNTQAEQQKLAAQNAVIAPQPTAAPPKVEPMPAVTQPQVTVPSDDMHSLDMQDAVQKKIDSKVEQVEAVTQKNIAALGETVKNIEQDIYTTHQNIEQLTMAMQHMLIDIQKIKEATKPKPKKKVRKPPVAYHVRAIVPGRVWLRSATGKNVSLRVGDKLEGYGAVRVISPRQGMVLMSNGSILQYGVNDF